MDGLNVAFEIVKIPIGGVTMFEMPTDNPEETESVKEFSAVILHHHPLRAYYKEAYTGGTNPPDCGSFDGVIGSGNCADCIYNEFGTGVNGAKACKEKRRLYLLREGDIFPMILSIPTGSLKAFSRYLMKCLPKWGASNGGVTKFTLMKATNSGGIVYTKAQFQMERKLTDEEFALVQGLTENIKHWSQNIAFGVKSMDNHIEKSVTYSDTAKPIGA
ncbi:MAG: hypothetical protein IKN43_02450 [Selenomonadaceae bacterium]|nr:hypothetical protein [Selenomonadaceae bacterium]